MSLDEGLVPFNLYDYQEEIVDAVHTNRFVRSKITRQAGKTTRMRSYILHYVLLTQSMTGAVVAKQQSTAREHIRRIIRADEELEQGRQQVRIQGNNE